MTKLRTTRSENDRRPACAAGHGTAFSLAMGLGLGSVMFGSLGCGQDTRESADPDAVEPTLVSERPLMVLLAAPRSEWIDYSPRDRKLTFYDLPASGRWMIKRSDRDTAYPVGPEHVLPEGLDPSDTMVFYVRAGGQTSRSVTLAQIQAARPEQVSIAR